MVTPSSSCWSGRSGVTTMAGAGRVLRPSPTFLLLLRLLLLLLAGAACTADGETEAQGSEVGGGFRLGLPFAHHMVLQREPPGAVIWGYGRPGAHVTVTLRRHPHRQALAVKDTRVREPSGTWLVVLDPMGPGGPYELVAEQTLGRNQTTRRTVRDVYFGDVWLCGGQSNMEMTVSQIFNASKELSEASAYPDVRIFAVSLAQAEQELEDLEAVDLPWSIPTAENLGHGDFQYFSALCWLFGRQLYDSLHYPIGLVASSWGGTPIEAWSSPRSLRECGLSQGGARPAASAGPSAASVLWNAMIHPLLNMTLKGAIWYQGEANTVLNTDLYNCTFPALIRDWRQAFHQGSRAQTSPLFPFGCPRWWRAGRRPTASPASAGTRRPTSASSPTRGCPTPSWPSPWTSATRTRRSAASTPATSRRWPTGCSWGPAPWPTERRVCCSRAPCPPSSRSVSASGCSTSPTARTCGWCCGTTASLRSRAAAPPTPPGPVSASGSRPPWSPPRLPAPLGR
ncbi:sialate O-acetylesterase isoform X2 [Ornithorhynchus anatinus]|uniref:sialate O-acetylesterase isoform X2 n=1 Tax=Ornithorhynchus anatinus TaxID=9258 RepID=UPI0010A8D08D|nr:sialate O-acetylesterase isoform X2 [Ornithorhynchus anatinus]